MIIWNIMICVPLHKTCFLYTLCYSKIVAFNTRIIIHTGDLIKLDNRQSKWHFKALRLESLIMK